jgi:hypothetical protein
MAVVAVAIVLIGALLLLVFHKGIIRLVSRFRMKTSVAITLVVCGTLLIVLPLIVTALNSYGMRKTGERLMLASGQEVHFSLDSGISQSATEACMWAGILMIAVGALGGLARAASCAQAPPQQAASQEDAAKAS